MRYQIQSVCSTTRYYSHQPMHYTVFYRHNVVFAVQSAVYMRERRGSADLYSSFRVPPNPNYGFGFIERTNARPVMKQTFSTKNASLGVQAFRICSSEALYDTIGSHSHICQVEFQFLGLAINIHNW